MDEAQDDHGYMKAALKLAEEALDCGEVPIGCVVVHRPGHSSEQGQATKHAEIDAIDSILNSKDAKFKNNATVFEECTFYVTVEPCIMCVAALRILRVSVVVFGCHNERFGGCGSTLFLHRENLMKDYCPSISIKSGIYKHEAIKLLRRFYLRENQRAPKPKKKGNRALKDMADDL